MDLQEFFTQIPKAAIAFSGGADSAFLMWAAKQYGCDARAYYVKTAFQPEFELEDARRLAGELWSGWIFSQFRRRRITDRTAVITVREHCLPA